MTERYVVLGVPYGSREVTLITGPAKYAIAEDLATDSQDEYYLTLMVPITEFWIGKGKPGSEDDDEESDDEDEEEVEVEEVPVEEPPVEQPAP
jgi:hypothetical protein